MIKTASKISVALYVLSLSSIALAAPKDKQKTPEIPSVKCESRGESIRRCYVLGDANELELRISKDGGQVFMTLEEPATMAFNDDYIETHFTEKSVLFTLKKNKLPKGHKLIVRTRSMILTLKFRVVTAKSDSQVQVLRAGQEDLDLAVLERVDTIQKELEEEHREALNDLEAKAARMSRQYILSEVHARGAKISEPGGDLRARENFLVFRATKVVRIGSEQLLKVTLQERGGDTFLVGQFKVLLSQGGATKELDTDFRCGSMSVRPGKKVACYISLGSIDRARGNVTIDIEAQGENKRRTVRLNRVELP